MPWLLRLGGALVVGALAGLLVTPAQGATLEGTVDRVVDGDTIKVEARGFEDTVRVIGIDTPETVAPGRPVQCGGPAATAQMKRLLPTGQPVRLVTDPTQDTRDRYGRLLAYVYKPGRSGPTGSVNYSLVASGHARVYIYNNEPFRYAPQFLRAEARAKKAKRGIGGPPCNGNTTKPDPGLRR